MTPPMTRELPQAAIDALMRDLADKLANATPEPARNRGELLTLRARHFGDSTEITNEHTADTIAIIDDGCPNHEAVADLLVAAVNALPQLLAALKAGPAS